MRWLCSLAILLFACLAGCKGGAPYNGSLTSAAPTLPATATFNGSVVPPPPTGSYAPTRAATPSLAAGATAVPNPYAGFQYQPPATPPAAVGTGVNPNAVASNADRQSPFWQRYQPLSLNTTTNNNVTMPPGFQPSTAAPPTSYGTGVPSTPANVATANSGNVFGTPNIPSGFTTNTTPTNTTVANAPSAFGSSPNAVSNPTTATYAGDNPILAWANRLNRLFTSSTSEPGQWQSWSTPASATQATGTPYNNLTNNNQPPGFTPTANATSTAANPVGWQNRPEPRSLHTSDTYAPEPAIRIPESASAPTTPARTNSVPSYAPPSYPASPNAATSPAPSTPLPPRNTTPAATSATNNTQWPELSRLPK